MKEPKNQKKNKLHIDSVSNTELYRILFEEAADGIFITDANWHFIAANPRFAEITGYPSEKIPGLSILKLITPEDLEKVPIRIDDYRNGKIFTRERRIIKQDGSLLPVEISTRMLPEGNLLGIVRDISKRKHEEKELVTSKNIMSRAEIISHYGSWEIDLETKKLYGSEGAQIIYGLKAGEWSLPEIQKIPLPEYREILDLALRNLITKNIPYNVEFKIKRKNTGEILDICSVAEYDHEKNIVYGIIQDITARRHAEDSFRDIEKRLRSLIDSAPFGAHIYELDVHGRLIFKGYNKAADRILGVDNSQFLGKTIEEAFPPLILTEIPECYRRVASTGVAYNTDQIEYKDAEILGAFEVRAFQIEPGWMTAFFIDITERKKAEIEKRKLQEQLVQAQKMESIGRLAGGVAHDFNNLLNVILGHAEMALLDINTDHPYFESFFQIRSAARHSAELTRQLLTFARKQTIAPIVIDLNAALELMLRMMQRLIGEDIELAWIPGTDLWTIRIDPSQINQVLANLCINSRDAIDGSGKITIETKNLTIDDSYCSSHAGFIPGEFVMLAVSDNGSGMDKETMGQLFEPFFTTKNPGKGTGLGLATVYGIVKQNDGFINVYSEPAQGTTFTIYMPRYSGTETTVLTDYTNEPDITGGNETILLVEDESSILGMAKTMLESLGYRVLASSFPEEALILASENSRSINLLMTDVIMPKMNGRELSQNLLTLYPHIKCLYMSGYTANVIAHHGVLDEGINFIQKPFSMHELAAKVREVLDSKKPS
jgi:two-component system, cell cycle sensor histidine kinase and response regulator CckA